MEAPPPTSCLGALTEYKTVGVVVVVVGIVVVVVPRRACPWDTKAKKVRQLLTGCPTIGTNESATTGFTTHATKQVSTNNVTEVTNVATGATADRVTVARQPNGMGTIIPINRKPILTSSTTRSTATTTIYVFFSVIHVFRNVGFCFVIVVVVVVGITTIGNDLRWLYT